MIAFGSPARRRWRELCGVFAAAAILALSSDAHATRLRVCAFSFNAPNEVDVFKRLPSRDFEVVDFSKRLSTRSPSDTPVSRLLDICSPDLKCDIVVYAAEFAGRFFGERGTSIGIHELEEASCNPACRGLFHDPSEVFLLGCNTLATKDRDNRTPQEYLDVLMKHGFDGASAEHAVELRYGPLGPSFRQSVRRIFAGVPRVYGFKSVAPRAQHSAHMLEAYFRARGDYSRYLADAKRDTKRNRALHAAYATTNFAQTSGLQASEPAERDGHLMCALYDEARTVRDRLGIIERLSQREDFLAYVPTMKVFFSRHAPATLDDDDRRILDSVANQRAARERVLRLVRDSDLSAVSMDLAQLAFQLRWMDAAEFNRLALRWTRRAISWPTSDAVDVACEISQLSPFGRQLEASEFPTRLFRDPEGLRMLDCLSPLDPRIDTRLAKAMDEGTPALRLWATYALSRRSPLSADVLRAMANHVDDPSPEVRDGLRWVLVNHLPLPKEVRDAVASRDPQLGLELADAIRQREGTGRRGGLVRPQPFARATEPSRGPERVVPISTGANIYALESSAFRSTR